MTTHIEKRKQTFKLRNQNITVEANALIDDTTNKILFDLDLDNQVIDLSFNIYRQKNNLISPAEMVTYRKQFQLSQRFLAKLLDVGSATITRYEKVFFTNEELRVLKTVSDDFKNYTVKKITDYSHQEKAYQGTKMKAVIPYNYALDL